MQRYGKDYKGLIRQCEAALSAPPPVNTPKIKFSGFPANMGSDACRMTLESIGPITSFDCEASEDLPILTGVVEFEDIEAGLRKTSGVFRHKKGHWREGRSSCFPDDERKRKPQADGQHGRHFFSTG